ncbi:MAG: OB-fold protein [Patescibacteria group bacterium]|jgi:hypothetical protein
MSEKVCAYCHQKIDSSTEKCPRCQAKLSWFAKHPVLTGIITTAALTAVIFISNASLHNTTQGEVLSVEDTILVNTMVFIEAFDRDYIKASQEYLGKLIQFNAIAYRLEETPDTIDSYLKPSVTHAGTVLKCSFSKDHSTLTKDEAYTIQGIVDSFESGIITLTNCRVIE